MAVISICLHVVSICAQRTNGSSGGIHCQNGNKKAMAIVAYLSCVRLSSSVGGCIEITLGCYWQAEDRLGKMGEEGKWGP